MPDPIDELRLLIRSRHPIITIETDEEQRAVACVLQIAEGLAIRAYRWNLVAGLRGVAPASSQSIPDTQRPAEMLKRLLATSPPAVFILEDLVSHLKDAGLQRMLRTFADQAPSRHQTAVLIDPVSDLPRSLARTSVAWELALPSEAELDHVVRQTFKDLARFSKVRTELTKDQFARVLRALRGLTGAEARLAVSRAILDDDCLSAGDIDRLLAMKCERVREAGLLEYVESDLPLAELGGLERLKDWLAKRAGALTPEAKAYGLNPPRGILLLGVQGCGKSAACKAVASLWQMPLVKLDPGALYDKYVGETERNLRQALRQAESMSPLVLWIDEIEKAFASASAQSSDGGLSQRMFGTLLSWLQDHRHPIFVVATANNIEALPPELLRKGRFDEIFFIDLPDEPARRRIFETHLRRRQRDPGRFDLAALAASADGFSGAEIEQTVVSALYSAFANKRDIDTDKIRSELALTRPLSVTMAERIAALRTWASQRCVAAG